MATTGPCPRVGGMRAAVPGGFRCGCVCLEGYLKNVLEMPRRKTPADPGARRVLAELALDTREKIRECRLAIDWIITKGPASVEANTRLFQIADKIDWLRDDYR